MSNFRIPPEKHSSTFYLKAPIIIDTNTPRDKIKGIIFKNKVKISRLLGASIIIDLINLAPYNFASLSGYLSMFIFTRKQIWSLAINVVIAS